MRFLLNFVSKEADKQKQKRIRRFTAAFYLVIWIFSAYVLFEVYSTHLFMANIYQSRISKIERKIARIEPRILFLQKKVAERNRLVSQARFYIQERSRPSVWFARLVDLSRFLPPDLALTTISYEPHVNKEKNKPEITIEGFAIIKGDEDNIFAVDNLRAALSESLPTKIDYSGVLVENNHLYKDEENLKLVFSLGYYR